MGADAACPAAREEFVMDYGLLSRRRTELMGIAILWVMLFHAFDLDLGHPLLNLIRSAGFGGVDIFILLSSMGLVMSLARREQRYEDFMARRAGRILPAYFLVMVPYTLFLILTQGAPWSALIWNATLLYYWVRPAGAFNWYVAGAMTFYALTPPCFRRLRDSRRPVLLTAGGILAGLAVCQVLMYEDFWYATDFFYRVPLFLLGLLMGFYVLEEKKLTPAGLAFWGASLAAGLVYLKASSSLDWGDGLISLPMCHMFLFTTVPMCLLCALCFEKLPLGLVARFFRLLGRNSLEIYLLNVSVFSQIDLLRRVVSFGPTNRLFYLLLFAVNILLGCLLHRLVEGLRGLWSARRGT